MGRENETSYLLKFKTAHSRLVSGKLICQNYMHFALNSDESEVYFVFDISDFEPVSFSCFSPLCGKIWYMVFKKLKYCISVFVMLHS